MAYLKSLFDLHQGDHKRSWLPTCGIFLLGHKQAISLDFPGTPPPPPQAGGVVSIAFGVGERAVRKCVVCRGDSS